MVEPALLTPISLSPVNVYRNGWVTSVKMVHFRNELEMHQTKCEKNTISFQELFLLVKFFKIIERICSPPCNIDHGVCGTDPKNPEELICYCQSGYTGDSCDECKTTDFYFYLVTLLSSNLLKSSHQRK